MLDTAAPPTAARVLAPARRPEVLLGAVLTILYGVLLLLDLSVPQPTDHSHYMHAARTFPSKPTSPLIYHQYLRIGLTGPTALVMKVFGYSEVTYHALPVVSGLALFGIVASMVGHVGTGRPFDPALVLHLLVTVGGLSAVFVCHAGGHTRRAALWHK